MDRICWQKVCSEANTNSTQVNETENPSCQCFFISCQPSKDKLTSCRLFFTPERNRLQDAFAKHRSNCLNSMSRKKRRTYTYCFVPKTKKKLNFTNRTLGLEDLYHTHAHQSNQPQQAQKRLSPHDASMA